MEHRMFLSAIEYFVNICEKLPTLRMYLHWAALLHSYPYCSKAPNTRVKYVTQRASCCYYFYFKTCCLDTSAR